MSLETRRAGVADAELVHEIYVATPSYFDIISIPIPTVAEVATELATAERDARRHVELLVDVGADAAERAGRAPRDPETGGRTVGYLDYTLDYPDEGDATVNLLLVHGDVQSRGYGRRAVAMLERRVHGRARRLLAAIYGRNPRGERFWRSLGYRFAIDARPVLEWYAKELEAPGRTGSHDPSARAGQPESTADG